MGDESGSTFQEKEFDAHDLQKCSGGLALQGVLLTKQLEDQLKGRHYLLEVPEEVIVTEASKCEDVLGHFSLSDEDECFKKKMATLGCSITLSTIPVYGGVTISKTISGTTSQDDLTYFSTVKYSPIEMATYSFKRTDLKLSQTAKSDLKILLESLKKHGEPSTVVHEGCTKFFDKYGSHANLGPLTYGGHFLWTCSSREFSGSSVDLVKEMQQTIITNTNANSAFTNPGANGVEIDRALYEDKYTGDMLDTTQLKVKVTGGPLKSTDIAQWKSGLFANKSTWVLTNRGKKLIAVWDIIKINHDKDFKQLIKPLRASWEKMTGLVAEQDLRGLLSYNAEDELAQVTKWNKETKPTPEQIQQRLKHLLKIKKDILDKRANLSFWISSYLLSPALQNFLLSVVNAVLSASYSDNIKATMTDLVELEELDQLSMEDHPSIKKVSDWLYRSPIDLQGFNAFLTKTVEEIKQSGKNGSHEAPTKKLEKEIRRLRFHYQKKYEDVLITILVYPFQSSFDSILRLKPLSLADLESLNKSFSEEIPKFRNYERNRIHLQSYLLLAASNHKSHVPHFKNFMMRISQMMKEVQPPPEKKLLQRLNRDLHADSANTSSSIENFKQHLESLLKSSSFTYLRQPSIANIESLKLALQTKMSPNQLPPAANQSSLLEKNPAAHALFDRLGLSEHYPKQLCLQDALCIRPEPLKISLSHNPPTDLKQLPYLVLHKLMSYDSDCRSDLMPMTQQEDSKSVKKNENVDDGDEDDYVDSDDESNLPKPDQHKDNSIKGVHPIDCLLTLILCCDDFLSQDLYSRMAKCQLAVPFLLPDPFTKQLNLPLWAMSSIIKEWKVTKGDDIDEHVDPLVDYPMPIVSFIRFGKYQNRGASKSRILNMVISDSHHDYFFLRDCLIGQYERILGEGLVDICWYLPTGKSGAFPDTVAFLNLHGDARHYPEQARLLSQISSMCFALVSEENLAFDDETMKSLEQFNSSPGGIAILNDVEAKPKTLKKRFPNSTVTNFIVEKNGAKTTRSSAEIKDIIRRKIKAKLTDAEGSNSFKSIRKLCIGKTGALVDEDSKSCQESIQHANKFMSIIAGHKDKKLSVKEAMLPLHGEGLWKAWAACDKELHRHIQRGNKSVNEYTAMIETDKAAIRTRQLKHVDLLTPVMDSFLKSLLSLGGPPNRILRNYFLQSLKLELNSLSRVNISGMQNKYQSKRKALSLLQTESADIDSKKAECKQLKEDLENLQGEIINFSFGLEHLFRELGQVYEAALESQEYEEDILSRLPKAAAELLIDGYPLEVMDGDAAHVPVDWVTAVLKETANILGDPKVFVLSVLGLQSTGKSTMLNTAFGVQFNVSAGRCTRGAFMQLLSLDKDMKAKTGCSYILVVDTEGLRAPELDPLQTQKHDNELATFVIGLANVTLINIYGEVPGDMDDILQTSVHAFLRMTEIKYHPSCQFVHQNAGANIKNEVGRAKFTKKLNQFTLDAAKEEQREGQYKSFNDVIRFDDQTDVHYFPGLWKGDPPLAPVNQGYSNAAQRLKQRLVEIICDRASSSDLNLSSFHVRVNDLWNTLLKEKFVFSFKNTLEITAYNSLETAYSQWAWKFQEAMLKWEQEAENEISIERPKNIAELVAQKIIAVKDHALNDLYQPLKEKMEEFFKGNQSEILIQWKADFEIRLTNLQKELLKHAEDHCNKLLSSRQTISEFKKKRVKDAEYIKEKVQQQLKSIKEEQEELKSGLEKRHLKPKQLQKLLKRNLFTPMKLKEYLDQQLIIPSQEVKIRALCRQLTETSLKEILVGGVLAEEQVTNILMKSRPTDEELKADFEAIWKDMTKNLAITSPVESVQVEKMVTDKLNEFARSKGSEGKLISKLKEATLSEWGARFDFTPEEKIHFNKLRYLVIKLFHKMRQTDPDQDEAKHITEQVFSKVCVCVQEMGKKDTDFKSAFTVQLLNLVDTEITEQSKSVRKILTFTKVYRLEMYLIACGFALPKFEEIAVLFRNENNPLLYLEKHVKGPEFIKFKNQYHQREAEGAIADTLCAYLEEPIKVQIGKSLGRDMVTKMKAAHHFTSKMALKVKVLTDLLEENVFDHYMVYVKNVKRCLEEHIRNYTIKYCDESHAGNSTRLQEAAKDEVTRLLNVVEEIVTGLIKVDDEIEEKALNDDNDESEEKTDEEENKTEEKVIEVDIENWLSMFTSNQTFRRQLGVDLETKDLLSGYDPSQKINLKAFIRKVKDGLKELEKTLHSFYRNVQCEQEMVTWNDKPHEILKSLIGCTAQCPFCGEQCDQLDPNHIKNTKHKTEVHRMDCLAGWREKDSKIMVTNFCPVIIDSDRSFYKSDDTLQPYRKYQDVYGDWSIPPDRSSKNSLYWKWFVGTYKDQIATSFNAKPPKVPPEWAAVQRSKVQKNLEEVYKI